jgi:hypothetical protein
MSDSWEKDKSVWHNAGNFAEYELKKVSLWKCVKVHRFSVWKGVNNWYQELKLIL